jgi:hypothetical protein
MWTLPRLVDVVHHRGERGRLARAGRTGAEHEAARQVADPLADLDRQADGLEVVDLERDHAQHGRHGAPLHERVGAEAAEVGDAEREVDLEVLLQLGDLVGPEHRVDGCAAM